MLKTLTEQQVKEYKEQGYLTKLRVLSAAQTQEIRTKLEAFEASQGAILDVIEDLYGENILCWTTNFFIKEANDPSFVSWHQDSTYWGLSSPDVITAWIALSPSNEKNGAMAIIPGTHRLDQVPHRDSFAKNNLLTRGQEIAMAVDETKAFTLELEPGEMSLHHVRIIHGSPPNPSAERRIGFAIRYIPTFVKQIEGDDSATLVRGVDTYQTFTHEPRPSIDMAPEFVALHQAITDKSAKILYKDTKVNSYDASMADPKERA